MIPRVSELIEQLDLEPHMEGGFFKETFRSRIPALLPGKLKERKALTTIYYLLGAGEYDSWHRLDGDEVWHFYEGAEIELFWIEPGEGKLNRSLLGGIGELSKPVAAVPGGCWQMARTTGDYTLVGCTVGPGFEYEDFELLRDFTEEAERLRILFPELAEYL